MNLLLAGLTVLVLGDSHLATPGYLITTLHDALEKQGAVSALICVNLRPDQM